MKKRNRYRFVILALSLMLFTACGKKSSDPENAKSSVETQETVPAQEEELIEEEVADETETAEITETTEDSENSEISEEKEQVQKIDADDLAETMLSEMTLEEKLYQLFFITPEALTGVEVVTEAGDTTRNCIEAYPVGGIIYFAQNIQSPDQIRTMISNMQSFSAIPIFTGVDEEGGIVSRIGNNPSMGNTQFPSMYNIGETGELIEAYNVGLTIGSECKELGFNLDFAPVADVFSNPANTVIGERAFSSDPDEAADMVSACVSGFKESGMLCTLKHFPGHGDTLTDSHYGAASTDKTLKQLKKAEFLPFKKGIKSGADFVMLGHILTPNITDDYTPTSLSPKMISILRDKLDFEGIVITDAMNMGAIVDYYSSADASIKAIQAGVDMLLMPADFQASYNGLLGAVESGEISEERIDESVFRILRTKISAGIIENEEE